jgi:ribonuclease P protein component
MQKNRFTLHKSEIISSKILIDNIHEKGYSLKLYPFFCKFLELQTNENTIQFIFVVGKKRFKKSVDRNKIKRLFKEAYRLNKHTFINKLNEKNKNIGVFFSFIDNKIPTFNKMNAFVINSFEKIINKI